MGRGRLYLWMSIVTTLKTEIFPCSNQAIHTAILSQLPTNISRKLTIQL